MDVEGTSYFVYTPLGPKADALRFVTVEPCFDPTDQVVCTLYESCLSENDFYTALSYTWGPPGDDHFTILLNGAEFFVRANLWSFLCHARIVLPGRCLWIDAICIDQTKTQERNHQVKIMGAIYSKANRVIVWLSNGDPKLQDLFKAAENLYRSRQSMSKYMRTGHYDRQVLRRSRHYSSHLLPQTLSHLEWIPPQVIHLLLLPYWQRTWIVQEVLLATNLSFMCGVQVLDFDTLMKLFVQPTLQASAADEKAAIEQLTSWYQRQGLPHKALPWSIKLLLRRADPGMIDHDLPICEMVDTIRGSLCLDPRDHIFGLLSLIRNGRTFPVDYSLPRTVLVLQLLAYFGGGLQFLIRIMHCLQVSVSDLYTQAIRTVYLGDHSSEIAPVVTFEISNECSRHSQSQPRIARTKYEAVSERSRVRTDRHYLDRDSNHYLRWAEYWPEQIHGNSLMLHYKPTGRQYPSRITSEHIVCSTGDPERLPREKIHVESLEPQGGFEGRFMGMISFSRPTESITRYCMTIDVFVFLLFPVNPTSEPFSDAELRKLTAVTGLRTSMPTANATFLGRFLGI